MPTFADLDDKIAFCFCPPTTPPQKHQRGGRVSVLYLLRRELIETAGYNPTSYDENAVDAQGVKNRLFASLIVMFTAFDLLAKFQLGDRGGLRKRFTDFLVSPDGAGMPPDVAELFYAVRNSLVHAFGVPDVDALAELGVRGVQLDTRIETSSGLVAVQRKMWAPGTEVATLYVDGVFRTLRDSIQNYRASLAASQGTAARAQFEAMFDKYGTIVMA